MQQILSKIVILKLFSNISKMPHYQVFHKRKTNSSEQVELLKDIERMGCCKW